MKLTAFLHKKLADLLEDRRIVVWYDAEGDFRDFIAAFDAPNCEVISAAESTLKARRRADEIYRLMNESDDPAEAGRNMLIYVPRRRGATEDEKMRDPFEVYALVGAAFGDTEDQKIESLARAAMPEKAEEIRRLFREGRPDLAFLDGLEQARRYPVLQGVFRTESPADVIALALCDDSKAKAVDETPGCLQELLRLLEDSVGFKTSSKDGKWKTLRRKAAEFVLFSEFAFDLPDGVPDALGAMPCAPSAAREVVEAACDRMRADVGLRDTYMELAAGVEAELRLPEIVGVNFDPGAWDTFPFEERRLLRRAVERAVAGDLAAVRSLIEGRKRSVWRLDPLRSSMWTALERGTALLESALRIAGEAGKPRGLTALVKAYTEEGWADLDRDQRLFETAWAACLDDETFAPLVELCRRRYRELVLRIQERFLAAVQAEGWPPEGVPRQTRIFEEYVAPVLQRRGRIAYFLVDSLRFEMGRDLAEALGCVGEVEIRYAAAVVPTVTDCGMAALMPGADGILRLVEKDGVPVTALGTRLLKTSADRMKLFSEIYGDRFSETTLDELLGSFKKVSKSLKNVDLLVVRTQDPDTIAEKLGRWRARRYLSDIVGDIATAVKSVISLGFPRVIIGADHGHMLLPEIPAGDVVESPPGGWIGTKRRCRFGSGLSGGSGTITLEAGHVGVQGDVEEVCVPIGFKVFTDGEGYFHGGLSLQEAVVPVVVVKSGRAAESVPGRPQVDILYRSDRFTSRVIGLKFYLHGDLFGTPVRVRIEAYDGTTAKAVLVGEAADCEARDEKTREVTLQAGKETPVPVLLDPDFGGPEVEVRVSDPRTRVVWARRVFKNAMLE